MCGRNGITVQEYEQMLSEQDGVCAICGCAETVRSARSVSEETVIKRLAIDHCHSTGRVRGLLCNNCNRGIGLLGDSAENLERAMTYLSAA